MTEKTDYLETVDVFQDLSPDELKAVGHQTRLVVYQAGHLFFMPEDPGEVLFILKVGRVQLYRISPDGRKLIVAILRPGAIFGHMALVGQRLHNTYAEAIDDVTICVWNHEEVERLLVQKPEVALRFLQAVSERLNIAEEMLTEITFKRVPARMAALLLRLREEHETSVLKGYTHQYLADMLGMYRETATQTLNDFKNQRLIRLGRKKVELLDLAGLEAIANET